ncbi:GAF and ANTAR domain-containing protein [Nocardioides caldifontis]|uniref:GAF and ANTAR domain-containing protein n=1 Tax=Nocardioides caldifontis TaxID=2588938 RepID=UPI0011DFEEAB|nr:GAF and ANTAR domain-containing protein [Nocardioides caldifontis]
MDDHGILEALERLSSRLTPGDLDATLERVTAAAVELLPQVDYASISVKHAEGRLETVAPTDGLLLDVDAAQYRLQEGPCYEAAAESGHVVAPDLADDARFPRYARVALEHGIRSQVGVRLFDAPRSQGALNLYSTQAGAFEDFSTVSRLFAHQAATAISYAHEITQLKEAIQTRGTIGQAVGILMERYALNDQRAFSLLTRLSQDRNVKLRTIADEVVASPDWSPERS